MAKTKFAPNQEDEVRKEEWGPRLDVYTGTAAALIKAGIVEEHMLPGQPGRNKTCVTFKGPPGLGRYGEGYVQIKRHGSKFSVRKCVSAEETARRMAEQETIAQQSAALTAQPANVIQGPWRKDGSSPYGELAPSGGGDDATIGTLARLLKDALAGKVIGLAYVAFRT